MFDQFKRRLKEEVEKRSKKIRIKEQLFERYYAELNITSLTGSSITYDSPLENLKFRFQPLISELFGFSNGDRRIDNCHGDLHRHCGSEKHPFEAETLSEATILLLYSRN